LSEPTKSIPLAAEGEDSTALDVGVCHASAPVELERASTLPAVVPNMTNPEVTDTAAEETTALPAE
jgi:hypothetical protein